MTGLVQSASADRRLWFSPFGPQVELPGWKRYQFLLRNCSGPSHSLRRRSAFGGADEDAEEIASDWQKAARFYARYGVTETMVREGVRSGSGEAGWDREMLSVGLR
jgi:hypothetical protein